MLRHAPLQGLSQLGLRGLHVTMRQGREPDRILLARHQGVEDRPAALAEHVGKFCIDLEVGVLQNLANALNMTAPLAHNCLPIHMQAARSVSSANTLSINAYQLAAFDAVDQRDSMRFVHTEASAHEKSRAASPPCVPSSALPGGLLLRFVQKRGLPSCLPSLGRVYDSPVLSPPALSGAARGGTMKALTPARLAHAEQVSPLYLPCLPNIPPPTTYLGPSVAFAVVSTRSTGLATQAAPNIEEARRAIVPPKRVRPSCGLFVRLRLLPTPPRGRRSCLRLHGIRLHIG